MNDNGRPDTFVECIEIIEVDCDPMTARDIVNEMLAMGYYTLEEI